MLLHSSSVLPPPHVPMRFMVMSHLHLTVVEVRKAFGLKCVECSAHLILTAEHYLKTRERRRKELNEGKVRTAIRKRKKEEKRYKREG